MDPLEPSRPAPNASSVLGQIRGTHADGTATSAQRPETHGISDLEKTDLDAIGAAAKDSQGNTQRIPTSLRTLRVMEVLSAAGQPMSIQALGRNLGLAKPTIYRLCATLIEEGYLLREFESGFVRPASRSVAMGNGLVNASRHNWARRRVLSVLSESIGETCNLAVPTSDGMTYVERVETRWPLRIQLPIGSLVPMHCTASGKLFLASLSPRKREEYVATLDLAPCATNTITDPASLLEALDQISEQGYSTDNEEFMDGLIAFAVPIKDPSGHFNAAIAVQAPKVRMDIEQALTHLDFVNQAARRLERELFEDPQPPKAPPEPRFS